MRGGLGRKETGDWGKESVELEGTYGGMLGQKGTCGGERDALGGGCLQTVGSLRINTHIYGDILGMGCAIWIGLRLG